MIRNLVGMMRKVFFRYCDELVRIELKCLGDVGIGWIWDFYINGEL